MKTLAITISLSILSIISFAQVTITSKNNSKVKDVTLQEITEKNVVYLHSGSLHDFPKSKIRSIKNFDIYIKYNEDAQPEISTVVNYNIAFDKAIQTFLKHEPVVFINGEKYVDGIKMNPEITTEKDIDVEVIVEEKNESKITDNISQEITEDIDYNPEEYKLSTLRPNYILYTEPLNLIYGETNANIGVELPVGKQLALGIDLGARFENPIDSEPFDFFTDDYGNLKEGWSLGISPKRYIPLRKKSKLSRKLFYSIDYQYTNSKYFNDNFNQYSNYYYYDYTYTYGIYDSNILKSEETKSNVHRCAFTMGFQFINHSNFVFEIHYGLGFRFWKDKTTNTYQDSYGNTYTKNYSSTDSFMDPRANFRIGYAF
jgi:hypothetical protein